MNDDESTKSSKFFIPTWLPPKNRIDLPYFSLTPGPDVKVEKDGSMHFGRTIRAVDIKDNDEYEKWLYFHALLTDSVELVDYYANPQAYVLNPELAKVQREHVAHDRYLDQEKVLDEVFDALTQNSISYEELYKLFLKVDVRVYTSIINYFVAGSLKPFSLRNIDVSYWQVVVYFTIIETLLGAPPECANFVSCNDCGRQGLKHSSINNNKWFDQQLFSQIESDTNRKQYKAVIDACKYRIRNGSIHNGLYPTAKHIPKKDGLHKYKLGRSIKEFEDDVNALNSLVKHLRELTRFLILNWIFQMSIYPELRGQDVQQFTLKIASKKK